MTELEKLRAEKNDFFALHSQSPLTALQKLTFNGLRYFDENPALRLDVDVELIPGREMVQVETLIPAGVASGWHVHPGEEVGYIIAGQVEMRVQGRATVVLNPGDGFLIPPRTPHNARDLGPETGRMLSTYIVETGQPIATFVKQPVQK